MARHRSPIIGKGIHFALLALLASLASCGESPSAPLSVDIPFPPLPPFPALVSPGQRYERTENVALAARYVLYDDGTFVRQTAQVTSDRQPHLRELQGVYSRSGSALELTFFATSAQVVLNATVVGTTLTVFHDKPLSAEEWWEGEYALAYEHVPGGT